MEPYLLRVKQVLRQYKTGKKGLSSRKAFKRLKRYGLNELKEGKPPGVFRIFFSQFKSFLILLLIAAAFIAFSFGELLDGIAISAIIVLNTLLGTRQEYKAEKAIEELKKTVSLKAKVYRDGKPTLVDAKDLTIGDIVILEAGSRIPADCRVIGSGIISVDQSSLTGESTLVHKSSRKMSKEAVVADRENMAFMGTIASTGYAEGIVTAIGMRTEIGKIAGRIQEIEREAPLKRKMQSIAKVLLLAVLVLVVALFGLGIFFGKPLVEMLLVSISLAVAAVPEGLPAVITITLAMGMLVMARKKAVVRRLPAVESLGGTTVICSDKTGTLTKNEMTVTEVFVQGKIVSVTGTGYSPEGKFFSQGKEIKPSEALNRVLKTGASCNNAFLEERKGFWSVVGDPTEGALIVAARKAQLNPVRGKIKELSFDPTRKMMSTLHRLEGRLEAYSKGAPEKVIPLCTKVFKGKTVDLTEEEKKQLMAENKRMALKGLRVLAIAFKRLKNQHDEIENDLVFLGLVGMQDPPREGVSHAIRVCGDAGIKVVMVTGDNKDTGEAIARQIGLPHNSAVTGIELDSISDKKLARMISKKKPPLFARVTPDHKLRIVDAFKKNNEIVAVTGDGVNDAIALKHADVGISMGLRGTDVAREASDIILEDDNFATIVESVKEGRRIYSNIINFVKYLLSANFGEIIIVATATIAGFPLPLIPLQILWINLVTDGLPALALGADLAEEDVMLKPPKKYGHPLKGITSFIVVAGLLAVAASFIAFLHGLDTGIDKARTMVFTTIIFFELVLVFIARGEKDVFSNNYLLLAVASSLLLQAIVVYVPFFQQFFHTVSLGIADMSLVFFLGLMALLVIPSENLVSKIIKKASIR